MFFSEVRLAVLIDNNEAFVSRVLPLSEQMTKGLGHEQKVLSSLHRGNLTLFILFDIKFLWGIYICEVIYEMFHILNCGYTYANTVEPRLSGPRLSGLFLWSQFGHEYLLVTIKIRSYILFKTTALKGAVKCESFCSRIAKAALVSNKEHSNEF